MCFFMANLLIMANLGTESLFGSMSRVFDSNSVREREQHIEANMLSICVDQRVVEERE